MQFNVVLTSIMMYLYQIELLAVLNTVIKLSIEATFQDESFDEMLSRFYWVFPV